MAKFRRMQETETEAVATAEPETKTETTPVVDGDLEHCFVNVLQNPQSNVLAFVSLSYHGMRYNNIRIMKKNNGELYMSLPSVKRMKNGEAVKGEDGKDIYDNIYFPVTKEVREDMQNLALAAYKKAIGEEYAYTPAVLKTDANEATCRPVNFENNEKLIGFANVLWNGIVHTNTAVYVNDKEEGYVVEKYSVRMKDGQPVKDEKGYNIRDFYYHPTTAEVRKAWDELVLDSMEAACNQA